MEVITPKELYYFIKRAAIIQKNVILSKEVAGKIPYLKKPLDISLNAKAFLPYLAISNLTLCTCITNYLYTSFMVSKNTYQLHPNISPDILLKSMYNTTRTWNYHI